MSTTTTAWRRPRRACNRSTAARARAAPRPIAREVGSRVAAGPRLALARSQPRTIEGLPAPITSRNASSAETWNQRPTLPSSSAATRSRRDRPADDRESPARGCRRPGRGSLPGMSVKVGRMEEHVAQPSRRRPRPGTTPSTTNRRVVGAEAHRPGADRGQRDPEEDRGRDAGASPANDTVTDVQDRVEVEGDSCHGHDEQFRDAALLAMPRRARRPRRVRAPPDFVPADPDHRTGLGLATELDPVRRSVRVPAGVEMDLGPPARPLRPTSLPQPPSRDRHRRPRQPRGRHRRRGVRPARRLALPLFRGQPRRPVGARRRGRSRFGATRWRRRQHHGSPLDRGPAFSAPHHRSVDGSPAEGPWRTVERGGGDVHRRKCRVNRRRSFSATRAIPWLKRSGCRRGSSGTTAP